MMANTNKQIVVIGNVGTGKSTLTDLLAKRMPAKKVPADSLFETNPFFPLAVQDRARWSLTSDLWFLYERVKIARNMNDYLAEGHVVVDSGLPMSYVYSHSRIGSGYFTRDEWNLYRTLYAELASDLGKPDVIVYLKGPVGFLRERVEKRGREFEIRFHTIDYLNSLAESLETLASALREDGLRMIEMDVTQVDFVGSETDLADLVQSVQGK